MIVWVKLKIEYIYGIVNQNNKLIVILSIKSIMESMGIVKEEE